MRPVVAGAHQLDVARAQDHLPVLLGRWQRQVLEQVVPSSAERDESSCLRAELQRVEQERGVLKNKVKSGKLMSTSLLK